MANSKTLKTSQDVMIDSSLFPYQNFPYRLQFGQKKDITICWFECEEHLDKYLKRYKLDKRTITINCRDEKPVKKRARNGTKNKITTRSKSN